jgi:hypothetical protein
VATNIPLRTSPVPAAVGTVRLNTTLGVAEIWNGSQWLSVRTSDPETWEEWFDYYISAAGNIPDQYTRQVHIQQEMQARFPGRYRIDLAGQAWTMVFDTPADETWFHLQHD